MTLFRTDLCYGGFESDVEKFRQHLPTVPQVHEYLSLVCTRGTIQETLSKYIYPQLKPKTKELQIT